jgi:hypothetical protein
MLAIDGEERVGKYRLSSIAICYLMLGLAGCNARPPNFIALDPVKRSDTWALERADIDCKAQIGSQRWLFRWRRQYQADPEYVLCMQQKGFVPIQNANH